MNGWSLLVSGMYGMITNTADEASALHLDIDVSGNKQFDAATEGVDVNLLVLRDDSLTQIHSDAAAESVEAGTVERLAAIHVLVTAVMNRTADSLSVLVNGQWALKPLVGVATVR